MYDFEQVWRIASKIDGWLTESQGRTLFEAAKQVHAPHRIVEIGSHLGRSTVIIALGAHPGVRVHAVDPFDDPRWGGGADLFDQFQTNLEVAGVRDRVEIYRGVSLDAAQTWSGASIGLVWVDGAHDRSSVLTDIDGWTQSLVLGGRAYFHDAYSAPGVTFALFQRMLTSKWRYLGSCGSLAMFERRPATLSSRARMIGRLGYFARNLAIKVGFKRGHRWIGPLLGWREDTFPY